MKLDGLPYSRQSEPKDQGAAVYFNYKNEQKVIACDSFDRIACNIWAIGLTIEAMRGMERWGCSEILTKAFTGFTALPENTRKNWWQILNINQNATHDEIKTAYRKLVKIYHPDVYGNDTEFKKIKWAYEQSRKH